MPKRHLLRRSGTHRNLDSSRCGAVPVHPSHVTCVSETVAWRVSGEVIGRGRIEGRSVLSELATASSTTVVRPRDLRK